MTEEQMINRLAQLSIEQLDAILGKLHQHIQQRDTERERLVKTPPRTSNDLETLADMQGLDLSMLMREAKKYG